MRRSRRTYAERDSRIRRRALITGAAATLVLVGVVVAVVAALGTGAESPAETEAAPVSAASGSSAAVASSQEESVAAAGVEVPSLTGRTLAEAQVLLEAMGVSLEIAEDGSLPADVAGEARSVVAQDPAPGTVVPAGAVVRLVVPTDRGPSNPTLPQGIVVVIDPGHQSRGDSTPEPIGPGSKETKPRVTGGTTGVETRVPEYEVVLQIATNLKARLEQAGIRVVMTRTTNDVNISNAERAQIANDAKAALFVRIHADGNVDASQAGVSTLYPGQNQWTGPIAGPSHQAAQAVHDAVVAATGAASRGLVARTDLAGFNWSKVPAVLVECGFMTNPVEDRLLSSPHYQDKLAEGMATGIVEFLGR